jgi:hypothetical protein
MIYTSLRNFVDRASEKKRIGFGDVRRLARDILPDGITSRDEADLLMALDRTVTKVDPAWADWLTAAMVDFAVWAARPTGYIDAEAAAWLNAALAGDGASKRAAEILREIAREAEGVDTTLIVPETRRPKRRSDRVEPALAQVMVETEAAQALLTA